MSRVIQADISDHDMIGCFRKLNNVKFKPKVITCRNYKSYNPDVINEELRCTNWNDVYSSFCPSKAWDKMKSILLKSLDKHAPWITKRVNPILLGGGGYSPPSDIFLKI